MKDYKAYVVGGGYENHGDANEGGDKGKARAGPEPGTRKGMMPPELIYGQQNVTRNNQASLVLFNEITDYFLR